RRKKIRTIKAKKFWLSSIAVVVIMDAMYVLMLPQGAARGAILRSGHPIGAVTLSITTEGYADEMEDGKIGYVLEDEPYEREQGDVMDTWMVYRHGMIYVGEYDTR